MISPDFWAYISSHIWVCLEKARDLWECMSMICTVWFSTLVLVLVLVWVFVYRCLREVVFCAQTIMWTLRIWDRHPCLSSSSSGSSWLWTAMPLDFYYLCLATVFWHMTGYITIHHMTFIIIILSLLIRCFPWSKALVTACSQVFICLHEMSYLHPCLVFITH